MTLWETIGKAVLNMNWEDFKFLLGVLKISLFPWLCTLMFWHMFNENPLLWNCFRKLRQFSKIIGKEKKEGKNLTADPLAKPCLSTWNVEQMQAQRLWLRQNSNKSLCNKDTCTGDHFRHRKMTETSNLRNNNFRKER